MTEGCLTTLEETQWKLAWVREWVQSNATCVTAGHHWISHSSDWTCGKLREFKKEESVHRVLLIKNEFAISALRNLPLAARLCHVPEQRDSGISAPRAASWLRSAALRAQAAVAPEWCHVVGIYSSKFNFQLSFLPWQKACLWDFSIQLSLRGSSGMMRGTDPSVILQKKTQSSKVQRRQHTDTLHYDNLAVCLLFGSSKKKKKKKPTILSRCLFIRPEYIPPQLCSCAGLRPNRNTFTKIWKCEVELKKYSEFNICSFIGRKLSGMDNSTILKRVREKEGISCSKMGNHRTPELTKKEFDVFTTDRFSLTVCSPVFCVFCHHPQTQHTQFLFWKQNDRNIYRGTTLMRHVIQWLSNCPTGILHGLHNLIFKI